MKHITSSQPNFADLRFRGLVAVSVGAVAAAYCFVVMTARNEARVADDFTWQWLAARALIGGDNPYAVIQTGGAYALNAPYVYPLTAAVGTIPFAAFLSAVVAATMFVGISATLLAWATSREGYQRFPIFLSVPFLWSCTSGQFAPIITASALLPAIAWVAPLKPNLGLAALAYRPSKAGLLGSAAFVAVSLIFNPSWPREWLDILPQRIPGAYRVPLSIGLGPVILLGLLRWRRPEARLLLMLSILPQTFLFYDQLLLWLVPKTFLESAVLTILSIGAINLANAGLPPSADVHQVGDAYAPLILAMLYLPCLVMVLRRSNEGAAPAWLEYRITELRSGLTRRLRSR